MERFTKIQCYGCEPIVSLNCSEIDTCLEKSCSAKRPCIREQAAIERLFDYEITGAEPADISARQKEIAEAEEEGRLFILPEGCEEMSCLRLLKLIVLDRQKRLIEIPAVSQEAKKAVYESISDLRRRYVQDMAASLRDFPDGEDDLLFAISDALSE